MQRLLFPWRCCRKTQEDNKLITLRSLSVFISFNQTFCLFSTFIIFSLLLRGRLECIQIVPELWLLILCPKHRTVSMHFIQTMFDLLSFMWVVWFPSDHRKTRNCKVTRFIVINHVILAKLTYFTKSDPVNNKLKTSCWKINIIYPQIFYSLIAFGNLAIPVFSSLKMLLFSLWFIY